MIYRIYIKRIAIINPSLNFIFNVLPYLSSSINLSYYFTNAKLSLSRIDDSTPMSFSLWIPFPAIYNGWSVNN